MKLNHDAKRMKRWVHAQSQSAMVYHAKGLGHVVAAEIRQVLADPLHPVAQVARLDTEAIPMVIEALDFRQLLELAARLRGVRELRWLLVEGKAPSFERLTKLLMDFEADLYFAPGTKLHVQVQSTASRLFHEGRLRDDVTTLLEQKGFTVVSREEAAFRLQLRLLKDHASLTCALSEKPLYQRSYKTAFSSPASIKEDLAAGLIARCMSLASLGSEGAYNPQLILVPFAGSGTLGFEAVLHLLDVAPLLLGHTLGFERLACVPEQTVDFIKRRLGQRLSDSFESKLPLHLRFIEKNAALATDLTANFTSFRGKIPTAPLSGEIVTDDVFEKSDAVLMEGEGDVFLPLNPPYGQRLDKHREIRGSYKDLGALTGRLLANGRSKKRRVAGFVLAPDDVTASLFRSALGAWETTIEGCVHGGKRIKVVYFMNI